LSIVERLLARRDALGLRTTVLYLDTGFCAGDILTALEKAKQPTLIACPIRGTVGKGGTRALCRGRKAYCTEDTFSNGTTARLAVVPTLKRDKKTRKQRRTW
jgi:hypothetical protein